MTDAVSLQPRERGNTRFHKIHNVQIALDFLRHKRVGLSTFIVDHNEYMDRYDSITCCVAELAATSSF